AEQLDYTGAAVDKALDGVIGRLVGDGVVKGKSGEVHVIHTFGKLPAKIVAVAGLGKREKFNLDKVRAIAGESCRALRKLNCHTIGIPTLGVSAGLLGPEESAQAVVEGSRLGLYEFSRYKESEYKAVEQVIVVGEEKAALAGMIQGSHKGQIMAGAAITARDMVNEPGSNMTPTRMAEIAREIADKHKLEFKVLNPVDMEEMGMGALLGVSKGSCQEPKLIILSYKGGESSERTAGFLGKGITFDSGGISIKPSEAMDEMKNDMAGGAVVIAALAAIAQLKPKVNITGIIPAAENLPSGSALKPGDIVKAMNGKTVEVISTDAEGRLILADALSYAVKQGLSPVIDLATLTGACCVALGTLYSGAFSNSQELMNRISQAADKTGERLWQMPMPEEYKEQNKSQIANVKNVGNRYGGAITAALFLSEFVGDTPWVHLDIAGTACSKKENGYTVKGATGVGVRALVELALSLAE
ncbi:MAG: leucyl aminopeptidase, partial [Chloroflexota bacterium]|nr:leucyl aminopeptidase [Chloroflexota bacterium]